MSLQIRLALIATGLAVSTHALGANDRANAADRPSSTTPTLERASSAGHTGFELMLRPGYGAAGGGSPVVYQRAPLAYHPDPGSVYSGDAAPYGAGFSGDASAGYRFHPMLSTGLYAETRTSSASSPNDGTSELSRSAWGAGLYLRGYAPMLFDRFDPYLQIGVGYVKDTQTYRRNVATTLGALPGDWTLEHHGVAVPLALGLDYRVLPALAVGPSFRYAMVFAAGGCLSEGVDTPLGGVSNKTCTDASEAQRVTKAESYGAWSAGFDVRLTL